MVPEWVLWTEINNRAAESAVQDQTARMCRLILPYTLRKINSYSCTATLGFGLAFKTRTGKLNRACCKRYKVSLVRNALCQKSQGFEI